MSKAANERLIRVSDGRVVSCLLYGDPEGFPVFYFHGTPGSGLEAALFDKAAKKYGAFVVAPDRPGVADSTLQLGRSVTDYASDIQDIAQAFGWERFSVMGWSGGAAYALVTGAMLADKVRTIGLLCPEGPNPANLGPSGVTGDAKNSAHGKKSHRRAISSAAMTLYHKGIAAVAAIPKVGQKLISASFWLDDLTRRKRRPKGTFTDILAASTMRATRNGAQPGIDDSRALDAPWGITVAQIADLLRAQNPPLPVWVWQGDKDRITPIRTTRALAAQLPDVIFVVDKNASHLQVILDLSAHIIQDMIMPRGSLVPHERYAQPKESTQRG